MTATTRTAPALADLSPAEVYGQTWYAANVPTGYRIGRCHGHGGGRSVYAWRTVASDYMACPVCGSGLDLTTRRMQVQVAEVLPLAAARLAVASAEQLIARADDIARRSAELADARLLTLSADELVAEAARLADVSRESHRAADANLNALYKGYEAQGMTFRVAFDRAYRELRTSPEQVQADADSAATMAARLLIDTTGKAAKRRADLAGFQRKLAKLEAARASSEVAS